LVYTHNISLADAINVNPIKVIHLDG